MSELDYLVLSEHSGELVQRLGTTSPEKLLTPPERSDAYLTGTVRLLSRRQAHRVGAQKVLFRAFVDSTETINATLARHPHETRFLLWSPTRRPRELNARDLQDSLHAFLSSADQDDVLVEVYQPDSVALTAAAFKEHFGEIAETIADEEKARVATETSPEALMEASAALRISLASDWPKAPQVSHMLGSTAENDRQLATIYRRDGKILGVYMVSPNHHYRFPRWQFGPNGQPVAQLAEILRVLREDGPFLDGDGKTTGWDEVEWFLAPHVLLDDTPPAEMLSIDPARVLEAAKVEFGDVE